jgi:hypothetical protein
MRKKGEDEREQPWTPQELDDLDALNLLWDSREVQRTMANLARYGSPYAPGEEPDEDEQEGEHGSRRAADR